jgi:hypothetical protein
LDKWRYQDLVSHSKQKDFLFLMSMDSIKAGSKMDNNTASICGWVHEIIVMVILGNTHQSIETFLNLNQCNINLFNLALTWLYISLVDNDQVQTIFNLVDYK